MFTDYILTGENANIAQFKLQNPDSVFAQNDTSFVALTRTRNGLNLSYKTGEKVEREYFNEETQETETALVDEVIELAEIIGTDNGITYTFEEGGQAKYDAVTSVERFASFGEVDLTHVKQLQKQKARELIAQNVQDLPDQIADNAKMISLLISVVSRIWQNLPATQRNKVPEDEAAFIDAALGIFKDVETRADKQFKKEGIAVAQRIFTREAAIANIVDNAFKGL